MGGQVSGAKNTFSLNTMTYEGLFNENYFKINQRETKLINNLEISYAKVKNPITNQLERFIGLFVKSKYDGVGIREQTDISLALDISGSMGCSMDDKKTRLDLAKEAIIKCIEQLHDDDNFAATTFENVSNEIIPFKSKKDFTNEDKDLINSLEAKGGTILYEALKGAYEQLKTSKSKNKRIILITDVCGMSEEKFVNFFSEIVNKHNIFVTIIAISEQSDTKIANLVSYNKGCNYYVVTKSEHLEMYLVKQFNYICFPYSYDLSIEYNSGNSNVRKIIGIGENNTKTKSKENKEEWKISEHSIYSADFKKNVNFLLLYFNRQKKRLPKPILANFCNFLRYSKVDIANINSMFPSDLTYGNSNEIYMNGGLFLLKLDKDTYRKFEREIGCTIQLKYTDRDGHKYTQAYKQTVKEEASEDYFSNKSIEMGIALYYYGKGVRWLINMQNQKRERKINEDLKKMDKKDENEKTEKENKENENNSKEKEIKEINEETKNKIIDYLNKHFQQIDGVNQSIISRYVERINKEYNVYYDIKENNREQENLNNAN